MLIHSDVNVRLYQGESQQEEEKQFLGTEASLVIWITSSRVYVR